LFPRDFGRDPFHLDMNTRLDGRAILRVSTDFAKSQQLHSL
jgi:hypothetical protein